MQSIRTLLAALILAWAAPVGAQETRVRQDGFESPPATLEQMDWLVGRWAGTGIGGAPAMESWLPPAGGTMVGTFVQQTADGEIQFTEHLYLMEEEGSLVLRLKHFNADLTGWEDKEGMVSFRLLAMEPCAAFFHGLTLRCADREQPGSGLVAAVRMQSGGELSFRFSLMANKPEAMRCEDASTTREIDACLGEVLARASARMETYHQAALERVKENGALQLLLRSTQEGFSAYVGGECGGVHEFYADGSIATASYLGCAIELTDERTHTIWENWLSYPDSTPPLLPEPKPTS